MNNTHKIILLFFTIILSSYMTYADITFLQINTTNNQGNFGYNEGSNLVSWAGQTFTSPSATNIYPTRIYLCIDTTSGSAVPSAFIQIKTTSGITPVDTIATSSTFTADTGCHNLTLTATADFIPGNTYAVVYNHTENTGSSKLSYPRGDSNQYLGGTGIAKTNTSSWSTQTGDYYMKLDHNNYPYLNSSFYVVNHINKSTISHYTVNVTQIGNTTTSFINTTTTGTLYLNLPTNRNYTVILNSSGYITRTETIIINETTNTNVFNYSLYAGRYLNISFINDTTLKESLTGVNITTSFISETSSFQKNTTNGNIYAELMIPETYFIRSTATNYENSYYYITIADTTKENLSIYMFPSSLFTTITASVIDSTAKDAEGVYIKVLKYDVATNGYVLREIIKTDSQGDALFSGILNDEFYKFILERPLGSVLFESTPGALTSTSVNFVIPSASTNSGFFNTIFNSQCSVSFNTATNNFRFTFTDSSNSVGSGCLYVDRLYSNRSVAFNSSCVTSNTGSLLAGIDPVNGSYYRGTGYVNIGGVDYFCGSAMAEFGSDGTIGQMGLFIVFILTIVIVFMLRNNPMAAVFSIPIPATFAKIAGIVLIPVWSVVALWALTIIIVIMLSKRV